MRKFQATLMYHKLAIAKACLFSLITLGTAWGIAMEGKDLSQFSVWDWVDSMVSIFILWGNQMLSFLDKTIARLSTGKPPIETGGTDFIKNQPENG